MSQWHRSEAAPDGFLLDRRELEKRDRKNRKSSIADGLQATNQRPQPAEGLRFDAVADAGTVDFSSNQPGIFQHLQVLRDG